MIDVKYRKRYPFMRWDISKNVHLENEIEEFIAKMNLKYKIQFIFQYQNIRYKNIFLN